MRYVGQGHEIPVALPVESYGEEHAEAFRQRFEQAYRQLYGRTIKGVAIEALSWTLTIAGSEPMMSGRVLRSGPLPAKTAPTPLGRQQLFDPAIGRAVEATVYLRENLPRDTTIEGPALITEEQTTTVVPPSWQAHMDGYGAIVLVRTEAANE